MTRNKYDDAEDVVIEIEYIKKTTNNDTEFTKAIYKMVEEIKEIHNL